MAATASCVGGLIPIPGVSLAVDLGIITKEINVYKSRIGLPEENSREFHKMSSETKEKVHKYYCTGATEIATLLTTFGVRSAAIEEGSRFIPLIGSAIAGGISFSSTYYFLQQYLNELEKTALDFLDEITTKVDEDIDFG
jgi:purine-cytosine permease-like protein